MGTINSGNVCIHACLHNMHHAPLTWSAYYTTLHIARGQMHDTSLRYLTLRLCIHYTCGYAISGSMHVMLLLEFEQKIFHLSNLDQPSTYQYKPSKFVSSRPNQYNC